MGTKPDLIPNKNSFGGVEAVTGLQIDDGMESPQGTSTQKKIMQFSSMVSARPGSLISMVRLPQVQLAPMVIRVSLNLDLNSA